ncbi:MAG: ABC transporter substrate-binding protein, partial [Candidatus Rokuibacteriota bacterium]
MGEIDSRTGLLAAQGLAIAQGIRIAVEQANAAGGLGGRPLRLLERDDEGKAERALAAAEELVGRHGVVALVGGYVDSLVAPVSEVAERTGVPYLAAASLDERLTARGYRSFFRISSLRAYVAATVGVVRDLARARRVAILHATTPGATQL